MSGLSVNLRYGISVREVKLAWSAWRLPSGFNNSHHAMNAMENESFGCGEGTNREFGPGPFGH